MSPDQRQIVSGSSDSSVMLWTIKSQLRAFKYLGHEVCRVFVIFNICFNCNSIVSILIAVGSYLLRSLFPSRKPHRIRIKGPYRSFMAPISVSYSFNLYNGLIYAGKESVACLKAMLVLFEVSAFLQMEQS